MEDIAVYYGSNSTARSAERTTSTTILAGMWACARMVGPRPVKTGGRPPGWLLLRAPRRRRGAGHRARCSCGGITHETPGRMRVSWMYVPSCTALPRIGSDCRTHPVCGGTTMKANGQQESRCNNSCVLLVAVPHARQGLCVQSEVGREGMIVSSGDGLSVRGTDVSGSPLTALEAACRCGPCMLRGNGRCYLGTAQEQRPRPSRDSAEVADAAACRVAACWTGAAVGCAGCALGPARLALRSTGNTTFIHGAEEGLCDCVVEAV
jgi:hypothetical protein